METTKWWQSAVIYELYVDKFAGTFRGLAEKMGYFETLGVNTLHILPHYPSPMVDDGYDISDYRNIRPELGTLRDFEIFMREAKKRGIHVILDLVLNHVSRKHPWFKSAASSKTGPWRDFFLWSETGKELQDAPNMFPHLKPRNSQNWIYNPATHDYYFATFYAEQPDLNWNNPKVFTEMTSVMDFWINLGVNGFRIDAAGHLIKKEGTRSEGIPETHVILKQIRAHLEKYASHAILLAEVYNSVDEIKKYFGSGAENECHMAYLFPLTERISMAALKNNNLPVEEMVRASFDIPAACSWAIPLTSHDGLTLNTLTGTDRNEFLAYCDSEHKYAFLTDSSISMRMANIFKKNPEKIRSAFDMLLRLPAVPIIYYGEEIGMENDTTIGTPRDTRRYVRGKFDWRLAEIQQSDPDSLFNFIRKLTREHMRVAQRGLKS